MPSCCAGPRSKPKAQILSVSPICSTALTSGGVKTLLAVKAPTTSPRDSNSETMPLTGSFGLVSMPTFSGPASTLKASSLPASFRVLTIALKAAVTRLLTSMLPIAVEDGSTIEPPVDAAVEHALASASPPIAAADASWPVWLMPLRFRMVPSNELVVATGMPFASAALTMSL